jgi:orotidine-5'-phosphate decarboxylase
VDQLLIALDVPTGGEALRLADVLRGSVGGFKIGNQLFTAEGPVIVRTLAAKGDRVFLDLKFHDIPNTVASAVAAATSLGVWMVNVHASGGSKMMQAAAEAGRRTANAEGRQPPRIIAVTVLTSMNAAALVEGGIHTPVIEQVSRLARLAQHSGLDGVVASPQETGVIRALCGPDFAIVTPGIRGGAAATAKNDQERTMTAGDAIAAGASHIVVGRPVIEAPDPREAAEKIGEEIRAAARNR